MVKIPVIIRPEYVWYIEDVSGNQFMHCDVFNWSKTVWKQIKKDFLAFAELHGGTLYVCKEHETTGYLKFIKGLGFKLLKPIISFSGKEVYIYYWSK
jgi:hypothetical protein